MFVLFELNVLLEQAIQGGIGTLGEGIRLTKCSQGGMGEGKGASNGRLAGVAVAPDVHSNVLRLPPVRVRHLRRGLGRDGAHWVKRRRFLPTSSACKL